jgi:hypothetical protein
MEGKWLSILEYAAFKKRSISTVRRSIKGNRVKFKEENGKYFIWTKNFLSISSTDEKELVEVKFENERLKLEIKQMKEELAERKMLINLYENGQMLETKKAKDLPELPKVL